MTRVALGGIFHETNTFARPTTTDDFAVYRGQELVDAYENSSTYLGGMLSACADAEATEPLPILYAEATPSGTIRDDNWLALRDELIEGICAAGPDAVVLALHGAGVAEGVDSIESDLCHRLRQRLGEAVPLVTTLDLHGNIGPNLAEACQALYPVRLNPHTDQHEQGYSALQTCLVADQTHPITVVERVPVAFPPLPTSISLLSDLNALCREIEEETEILAARIMHGFPYADVPQMGASIVVVATESNRARRAAKELATLLWQRRAELVVDACTPDEAVSRALELSADSGPVLVNEFCDNTGGGAPGDGTHLLSAMLRQQARSCYSHIHDPETVKAAHRAGVGATIQVRLGGQEADGLSGAPIEAEALVLSVGTGEFTVKSPMGAGEPIDLGLLCSLRIGSVDIVVTSGRRQTLDDRWLIRAGLDFTEYPVVAVKSSQHFRAFFADRASAIVTADASGLTAADLTSFNYERLSRRLWPLDPHSTYHPVPAGETHEEG